MAKPKPKIKFVARTVRMPEETSDLMVDVAKAQGITVNSYMNKVLTAAVHEAVGIRDPRDVELEQLRKINQQLIADQAYQGWMCPNPH